MTVAVRVDQLWKKYGYRSALAGLSLDVAEGECLAVFGPNGAGKSTFLRVLATRVRPTSGHVEVLGHDVVRASVKARRCLGVVFHESCLRADLTLDENLRFYEGLYGVPRQSSRRRELIERVGLADRAQEPVRGFSRGMMQRAALARSLLNDPSLWLLDEPFSGLDPEGRQIVLELVRQEHASGRTVVFVTHDIALGLDLSREAIIIEDGDIVARGHADTEAYFRPVALGGGANG